MVCVCDILTTWVVVYLDTAVYMK